MGRGMRELGWPRLSLMSEAQRIPIVWQFSIAVEDPTLLREWGLAALVDDEGALLDWVERTDAWIAADAVDKVVREALREALPRVGLRLAGGSGAYPREQDADGSYPPAPLAALNPDGSLLLEGDGD